MGSCGVSLRSLAHTQHHRRDGSDGDRKSGVDSHAHPHVLGGRGELSSYEHLHVIVDALSNEITDVEREQVVSFCTNTRVLSVAQSTT